MVAALPLSPEDVQHIATLARVGLSEDDVARFGEQLSQILEYFQRLGEVNTDDVPPTPYPLPLHNVMRDDASRPSYDREDVLANAPEREDDFFRVEAVLEE